MTIHTENNPGDRMDQLLAMRAFTRVVESGSFTRAADSLNMPIATLSKLVKSLETHLETRLLHRTTRRVVTTLEGAEYYEKALRVLIDIEDIDTSFRASCCTPKGHLRIDVGGSTARDVLIPLLPDFMQRYPDIRIDLGVADRPVDLIGGNVDCVIRGGPLDDSTLIARHRGGGKGDLCVTRLFEASRHSRVPARATQWSQAGELSLARNRTGVSFSLQRKRRGAGHQRAALSWGERKQCASGVGGRGTGDYSDVWPRGPFRFENRIVS